MFRKTFTCRICCPWATSTPFHFRRIIMSLRARAIVDGEAESVNELSVKAGELILLDPDADAPEGCVAGRRTTGPKGFVRREMVATEGEVMNVLGRFVAEDEGEVSIDEGQECLMLHPEEPAGNGWLLIYHYLSNKVGFVPSTFVGAADGGNAAGAAAAGTAPVAASGATTAYAAPHAAQPDETSDSAGLAAALVDPPPLWMALADFAAENDTELSMQEGGALRCCASGRQRPLLPLPPAGARLPSLQTRAVALRGPHGSPSPPVGPSSSPTFRPRRARGLRTRCARGQTSSSSSTSPRTAPPAGHKSAPRARPIPKKRRATCRSPTSRVPSRTAGCWPTSRVRARASCRWPRRAMPSGDRCPAKTPSTGGMRSSSRATSAATCPRLTSTGALGRT